MGSAQPPSTLSPSDLLEKHDKVITSNFEKMQSYSRVILGLGYAGLLAVWSATKQVLPERLLVASGLLIVISIIAYIVFEIGQMILYAWMSWRYSDAVARKGLLVALSEADKRATAYNPPLKLAWLITFPVAALTGFGAAGILIYAFCRRLFGHP